LFRFFKLKKNAISELNHNVDDGEGPTEITVSFNGVIIVSRLNFFSDRN
jgi:hypothetical protein